MIPRRQPSIVPGMLLGRCKVSGDYTDKHGHLRWTLDCLDCGRRSHIGSTALREHMRGAVEFRCPWCRPGGIQARKVRAAPPSCSYCHATDHNRATCPERDQVRKDSKWCRECSGLAHRREKPTCPGCGEPFEEQAPTTIEEAMEMPRNYDRVVAL